MTFLPPEEGALSDDARVGFEALSHSASIIHVGPNAPVAQSGGVAKNLPDWKRWFDTTNKLDKIWSPTHSKWITLTPLGSGDTFVGTTTNTSYGDLTGTSAGPAVTIDTGTIVEVDISCLLTNNGSQLSYTIASFDVTGATSLGANDDRAIFDGLNINDSVSLKGRRLRVTGLTAGSNTFTMKYRVTGGTATIERRDICVTAIPT